MRLKKMFEAQAELANKIFIKHHLRNNKGHQLNIESIFYEAKDLKHGANDLPCIWIKKMLECIRAEINEADAMLPWKHWAKDKIGEKEFPFLDQRARLKMLQVELVDIWHFLMEAMVCAGMTQADLYHLYFKKHEVNIKRQNNGYNTTKKTEADNEEIATN